MILDVSATITEAKYLYVTAIFYMIFGIAYVTTVVVQFLLVVGCYISSGLVWIITFWTLFIFAFGIVWFLLNYEWTMCRRQISPFDLVRLLLQQTVFHVMTCIFILLFFFMLIQINFIYLLTAVCRNKENLYSPYFDKYFTYMKLFVISVVFFMKKSELLKLVFWKCCKFINNTLSAHFWCLDIQHC